jgi:hypothetical protein
MEKKMIESGGITIGKFGDLLKFNNNNDKSISTGIKELVDINKKMYANSRKKYDMIPLGNGEFYLVNGSEKMRVKLNGVS